MFIKYLLQDNIIITSDNELNNNKINDEIKERFLNKIIKNLGICINILSINILDILITNKEANYNISFEVEIVCLHFEKDEIIMGKIIGTTINGLQISTYNFTAIISPNNMMDNTV